MFVMKSEKIKYINICTRKYWKTIWHIEKLYC